MLAVGSICINHELAIYNARAIIVDKSAFTLAGMTLNVLLYFFSFSGDRRIFHGHKISDHPGYAIPTEL